MGEMSAHRDLLEHRWISHVEWLALAIVVIGVAILHGAAIRQPFFADDYLFLEQVRDRSLVSALTSPDPLGNFFRPVGRQLWFWLLSRMGGESPSFFHAANLGIFLASLLVFHAIVRRTLGSAAALMAAALVGFHYAADVPLRWASGSQDLLAILFANLTIFLQMRERRFAAAGTLLVALLSKEVVAGAAIVAIVAGKRRDESWTTSFRRQAGVVAVTLAWAVWWLVAMRQHPVATGAISFDPGNAIAAMVHMLQVVPGLEPRLGGQFAGHLSASALLPALLAAVALGLALWRRAEETGQAIVNERFWGMGGGI